LVHLIYHPGQFVCGQKHGKGIYHTAEGETHPEKWEHGILIRRESEYRSKKHSIDASGDETENDQSKTFR
jgi:hypothetical protein